MVELVSPSDKVLIIRMIRTHIANAKLIAFGSRIRGDAGPYSDLNLAIDAGRALTLHELVVLGEAFAETAIPYKIDIVDFHSVDELFKAVILKSGCNFELPAQIQ